METVKELINNSLNIYVYRNAEEGRNPILVHIPPPQKQTMKDIISVINERVKYPVGYAKKLYNMNGVLITDPNQLFMNGFYVVSSNYQKSFKYIKYGPISKALATPRPTPINSYDVWRQEYFERVDRRLEERFNYLTVHQDLIDEGIIPPPNDATKITNKKDTNAGPGAGVTRKEKKQESTGKDTVTGAPRAIVRACRGRKRDYCDTFYKNVKQPDAMTAMTLKDKQAAAVVAAAVNAVSTKLELDDKSGVSVSAKDGQPRQDTSITMTTSKMPVLPTLPPPLEQQREQQQHKESVPVPIGVPHNNSKQDSDDADDEADTRNWLNTIENDVFGPKQTSPMVQQPQQKEKKKDIMIDKKKGIDLHCIINNDDQMRTKQPTNKYKDPLPTQRIISTTKKKNINMIVKRCSRRARENALRSSRRSKTTKKEEVVEEGRNLMVVRNNYADEEYSTDPISICLDVPAKYQQQQQHNSSISSNNGTGQNLAAAAGSLEFSSDDSCGQYELSDEFESILEEQEPSEEEEGTEEECNEIELDSVAVAGIDDKSEPKAEEVKKGSITTYFYGTRVLQPHEQKLIEYCRALRKVPSELLFNFKLSPLNYTKAQARVLPAMSSMSYTVTNPKFVKVSSSQVQQQSRSQEKEAVVNVVNKMIPEQLPKYLVQQCSASTQTPPQQTTASTQVQLEEVREVVKETPRIVKRSPSYTLIRSPTNAIGIGRKFIRHQEQQTDEQVNETGTMTYEDELMMSSGFRNNSGQQQQCCSTNPAPKTYPTHHYPVPLQSSQQQQYYIIPRPAPAHNNTSHVNKSSLIINNSASGPTYASSFNHASVGVGTTTTTACSPNPSYRNCSSSASNYYQQHESKFDQPGFISSYSSSINNNDNNVANNTNVALGATIVKKRQYIIPEIELEWTPPPTPPPAQQQYVIPIQCYTSSNLISQPQQQQVLYYHLADLKLQQQSARITLNTATNNEIGHIGLCGGEGASSSSNILMHQQPPQRQVQQSRATARRCINSPPVVASSVSRLRSTSFPSRITPTPAAAAKKNYFRDHNHKNGGDSGDGGGIKILYASNSTRNTKSSKGSNEAAAGVHYDDGGDNHSSKPNLPNNGFDSEVTEELQHVVDGDRILYPSFHSSFYYQQLQEERHYQNKNLAINPNNSSSYHYAPPQKFNGRTGEVETPAVIHLVPYQSKSSSNSTQTPFYSNPSKSCQQR